MDLPVVENYYVGGGFPCPNCGQASVNLITGYYDDNVIMFFCSRCNKHTIPLRTPEDVDEEERRLFIDGF